MHVDLLRTTPRCSLRLFFYLVFKFQFFLTNTIFVHLSTCFECNKRKHYLRKSNQTFNRKRYLISSFKINIWTARWRKNAKFTQVLNIDFIGINRLRRIFNWCFWKSILWIVHEDRWRLGMNRLFQNTKILEVKWEYIISFKAFLISFSRPLIVTKLYFYLEN